MIIYAELIENFSSFSLWKKLITNKLWLKFNWTFPVTPFTACCCLLDTMLLNHILRTCKALWGDVEMHTAHIRQYITLLFAREIAWPLNIYQFIVQMPVKFFRPELENAGKELLFIEMLLISFGPICVRGRRGHKT